MPSAHKKYLPPRRGHSVARITRTRRRHVRWQLGFCLYRRRLINTATPNESGIPAEFRRVIYTKVHSRSVARLTAG